MIIGIVALVGTLGVVGVALIHLVLGAGLAVSGSVGLLPPLGDLRLSAALPVYAMAVAVAAAVGGIGFVLGIAAMLTRRGRGAGVAGAVCAAVVLVVAGYLTTLGF